MTSSGDEAIQGFPAELDCFASLAMTNSFYFGFQLKADIGEPAAFPHPARMTHRGHRS
jgi:hypothetical protein